MYLITKFGNVRCIHICLQIDALLGGLLMSLYIYFITVLQLWYYLVGLG
jgi:hypothetical protein